MGSRAAPLETDGLSELPGATDTGLQPIGIMRGFVRSNFCTIRGIAQLAWVAHAVAAVRVVHALHAAPVGARGVAIVARLAHVDDAVAAGAAPAIREAAIPVRGVAVAPRSPERLRVSAPIRMQSTNESDRGGAVGALIGGPSS